MNKDFEDNEGTVLLRDGFRNGIIELMLKKDGEPEFKETFCLQMLNVTEGAEINSELNTSCFEIRFV